ncbi:hypothetical protein HZB03_03555 [Candidatus Woesearchaeota archaeon]|nr:hypothetical protein [Candidatus Woesearchaeota archaeon]
MSVDAEEMYEEIPNAELDFVPQGKHFVNLTSPKLVDKFILHFLRAHSLLPGA